MHLESDNIEVMPYDNANDVVHKLFEHFFQDTKLVSKHQLEKEREREREREREIFFLIHFQLLHYICHKGDHVLILQTR